MLILLRYGMDEFLLIIHTSHIKKWDKRCKNQGFKSLCCSLMQFLNWCIGVHQFKHSGENTMAFSLELFAGFFAGLRLAISADLFGYFRRALIPL